MAPVRRFYGKSKAKKSKAKAKKSKPRAKYSGDSTCKVYRKSNCGNVDPNCGWRTKIGCVHKKGSRRTPGIYYGPAYKPI